MTKQWLKLHLSHWAWMLPILLLATVIASHYLTLDALWGDEVENLRNMGIAQYGPHTFDKLVEKIGLTRWPPAYNFVSYPWIQATGTSEFSLRTLSILLGVIGICMMYRLGKVFTDHHGGLLSALILGTSAFYVFYMHEMRGYILYLLMAITSLYMYFSTVHRNQLSKKQLGLLALSIAIFIYTHYIALLMAMTIGLYHLLFERESPHWGRILRALIFAGIAYVPWILIAILNTLSEANDSRGLSAPFVMEQLLHAFSNGLPLLLVLILLYALVKIRHRKMIFLWFCIGMFLVLVFGLNIITDYLLHVRHVSSLLPLIILIIVLTLQHLYQQNHWVASFLLIIWIAVGLFANRNTVFFDTLLGSLRNLPRQMVEQSVDTVAECATNQDAVIAHLHQEANVWNQLTIEYYFYGNPYRIAMLDYMLDLTNGLANANTQGTYRVKTERYINQAQNVWVIMWKQAHKSPQIPELGKILSENYAFCGTFVNTDKFIGYVYQNEPVLTCASASSTTQTLPTCVRD